VHRFAGCAALASDVVGDFERDTRIDGGDGRYTANLSRDWEIWGPNGGYLASIALRAAGAEASIARPVSVSGQFLRVADFGTVDVAVTVLKRGRSSETLRVSVSQLDRPVFEALVRTAAAGPGLEHDIAPAPTVSDPETLPPEESAIRHPFWKNLDVRWVVPPPHPPEDRKPELPYRLAWLRFRPRALFEGPFLDAARSLLLIDTMTWPAASLPHPDSRFRAPNLDVSAWFHRGAEQSEWLLVESSSPVAEAGLMGTVTRVFDRSGRLVASGGAQLFCVPVPPED